MSRLIVTTALLGAIGLWAGGCTIEHKVQPIQITVDVNIRVQKELESIFDYEPDRSIVTDIPVNP